MARELILAFDTSSDRVALALGRLTDEGAIECLVEHNFSAQRQANVQLMPAVEALFNAHELHKEDVAAVVVGLGPGSFTGVRIAVATAKGVARGLGVSLYGVSTLDAVAWGAWQAGVRGYLGVVADAMRGEIYPARYSLSDKGALRHDAHSVAKADTVAASWAGERWTGESWSDKELGAGERRAGKKLGAGEKILLAGDGLYKYREVFVGTDKYVPPSSKGMLPQAAEEVHHETCQEMRPPDTRDTHDTGESLCFELLDLELWSAGGNGLLLAFAHACARGVQGSGDAATLLPIYTRLSDAEENERIRLAGGGQIAQGALVDVPKSGVADMSRLQEINYRPMAASDVEQVALLEAASFAVGSATSGECWSYEAFADELGRKDRSWWVAYVADTLVGFAGAWVVDGVLQVLDVVCAQTHRRRGIARELLRRLLQDGRDLSANSASLEVRKSNSAAIALYESVGFEHLGERPNYYSPSVQGSTKREAAVIMEKRLGSDIVIDTGNIINSTVGQKMCSHGTHDACGAHDTPDMHNTYDACDTRDARDSHANRTPSAPPIILAIETSCDETAAAVINSKGQLLSNTIASQIDFHARFGGVVPEIASRKHTEAIVGVLDVAIQDAGLDSVRELDAIAVTYAPGLIGALVVGVAFAKGLAWATELPLIRVNHLEGHIYANRFAPPSDFEYNPTVSQSTEQPIEQPTVSQPAEQPTVLQPAEQFAEQPLFPPFIIALLSGGHTMLVHVRNWQDYRILGQSLDDAVGETFDKVAKALGLGYPGGPVISNLAKAGDPNAIKFPRALLHSHDYRFSLSGLKTAVITYIREQHKADSDMNVNDVAASFQQAVIDVQVAKAIAALQETGCKTFCMGGGVAANKALREAYKQAMQPLGIDVIHPPANACTDNAAMIALVALDRFRDGKFMPLDGDAQAHSNLEAAY